MKEHLTLRDLPGVDKFIKHPVISHLAKRYGRESTIHTIHTVLDHARKEIANGKSSIRSIDDLAANVSEIINNLHTPSLKQVVNATGIVLHTNLGRAPLGSDIIHEITKHCTAYSNLEFDTNIRKRGERNIHVEELFKVLTHAESALVVNNNAAALILTLNALAKDKEVIVSRGELIEIGGSFRLPDIIATAGTKMIEVGTTNKTRTTDYAAAINENTALILKVHKSNFTTNGFTEEAEITELAELARKNDLPLVYDIGSGLLNKIDDLDLGSEPDVKSAIHNGADIVMFSCDKIISGPQAGAIVGKKDLMSIIMKSPLRRALRVGKLTLAALSFVLRQWLSPETVKNIPAIKMLTKNKHDLKTTANQLEAQLQKKNVNCHITKSTGQYGGGTMPHLKLDSFAIEIDFPCEDSKEKVLCAERMFKQLLKQEIPVLCILRHGRLVIDVLTLQEDDHEYLLTIIEKIFHQIKTK